MSLTVEKACRTCHRASFLAGVLTTPKKSFLCSVSLLCDFDGLQRIHSALAREKKNLFFWDGQNLIYGSNISTPVGFSAHAAAGVETYDGGKMDK